jgi:hypothetical protein
MDKFITDFAGIIAFAMTRCSSTWSWDCRVLHTLTNKLHIFWVNAYGKSRRRNVRGKAVRYEVVLGNFFFQLRRMGHLKRQMLLVWSDRNR